MAAFVVFLAGALFAVGLALSGMTQPQKVIGFLDVFGEWDPSLMFVMGGAIATYGPLFRLVTKRKGPVFASLFQIPDRRDITGSLLLGSTLFGVGWGLGGFCPGPALASLTTGHSTVLVFIGAMLAGMVLYTLVDRARAARTSASSASTPGSAASPSAS